MQLTAQNTLSERIIYINRVSEAGWIYVAPRDLLEMHELFLHNVSVRTANTLHLHNKGFH